MAYEVTATRRRPQRFEDLAGQEFVTATLKNAITTGKIAHAYLFSGPRGCGKTSAARILAKALNCEKGPAATPCGVCSTCIEITRGSSMDVIEIDGASNTSVNDIRQIKDEVLFPPNSCRYKIYIIDEVHMLSTSAFNALLKTIEEPPPYIVFIFATTELHKVPATIKSRCQQFNFRLIPVEVIKNMLAETCVEIGIQAEDEALFWIARESTGSARDAYTLFDQVAAFSDSSITFEKIRDTLGLVGIERINELCEACIAQNAAQALSILDELYQAGISTEQFVISVADYLRNMLLIQSGISKESLLGLSLERFSRIVRNSWSAVQLERGLSLFLQLYRDIRFSLDQRYELELAVSRLCWLSEYVSLVEVKRALDGAKSVLLNGTSVAPGASTANRAPTQLQKQGENTHPFVEGGSPAATMLPVSEEEAGSTLSDEKQIEDPFASLKKNWKPTSQQNSVQPPVVVAPPSSDESNPPLTDVNARDSVLSIEQLREKIIELIKNEKTMLAVALEQTQNWVCEENCIKVFIDKPFFKEQLEADSASVSLLIAQIWGKKLSFEVCLKAVDSVSAAQNAIMSAEVELVCKMFKGHVVEA